MMFWRLNTRPKRQLLNRNFWSYHVGYHVCGALTIEMSGTTCWNGKPKTFWASEKNELRIIKIAFSAFSMRFERKKTVSFDNGNVLELKMMFWRLNTRPKGQLLNRNFWFYHVGHHVCGALAIEMSGTTCWNEKPKTFFASEKNELRIIKITF